MKTPYFLRLTRQTDAATAVQIDARPLKPGQWLEVLSMSLYNNSGENVVVNFGYTDMGNFTPVITDGANNGLSTSNSWYMSQLFLREGETLGCQVTGTADKGPVTFIASGWLHEGEYVAEQIAQELTAAQTAGS